MSSAPRGTKLCLPLSLSGFWSVSLRRTSLSRRSIVLLRRPAAAICLPYTYADVRKSKVAAFCTLLFSLRRLRNADLFQSVPVLQSNTIVFRNRRFLVALRMSSQSWISHHPAKKKFQGNLQGHRCPRKSLAYSDASTKTSHWVLIK
jgi:hypothetical protein